ncbi:periphilin-1-like isoform X2 [Engraulis encrasicolus]|uniref:periphilin-1-like isoform X2 n=1 Tax=Engraulis encrasicolus TaxID=184585 RepID=UPI002FD34ADD
MSYRRNPIREVYEQRVVGQQPSYQRTVSIERRGGYSRAEENYDRTDPHEANRYAAPRGYPSDDQRGYYNEGTYYASGRRSGTAPYKREDPAYSSSYYRGGSSLLEAPIVRQVEISSSHAAPLTVVRSTQPPAPRTVTSARPGAEDEPKRQIILTDRLDDLDASRRKGPVASVRDRSPIARDGSPSSLSRSGSSASGRSYSPDVAKSYAYSGPGLPKKRYEEPYASSRESAERERPSSFASSAAQDGPPSSSVSASPMATQDDAPAVSGLEKDVPLREELVNATDEERRAHAIAAKALEIEKLYRQDCETFGTVVKILVSKEPGLEKQLQGPLKDSLEELRHRCLDDLRVFIDDMDGVPQKQDTAAT